MCVPSDSPAALAPLNGPPGRTCCPGLCAVQGRASAALLMQGAAGQWPPPPDLDTELAALPAMPLAALRQRWSDLTGTPPPRVRRTLLSLALAWELQAAVYGGLSRKTLQRLAYMAGQNDAEQASRAEPGTRLLREWNGVLHTVRIDEEGAVHWNGKVWNSRSEVARAITGTRWSGPAFFGLKKKRKAA